MSYSITTISNHIEFFGLYKEWDTLLKASSEQDYYFSYDWYYPLLTACNSLPPGSLVVFVCRRAGELQGLFPCLLVKEKKRLLKVNTLELYGNVYTPRRGAIVRKGEELGVVNAFIDYLCNDFSPKWDLIDFWNLSKKDNIVCLLTEALTERKIKVEFHRQFDNVRTYLGDNGGEKFFASLGKNLRQNIRKGVNRFQKNGSSIIWLVENECQDINSAMNDYYQIYGESWKENEADQNFHRKLASYLATKNKLRLFILYFSEGKSEESKHSHNITSINDGVYTGRVSPGDDYIPIAACYFVVDGKVAYFLKTAYREQYRNYSAGTVLFWFVLKHCLEIDHCSIIDHQQGKEDYKLKWGEVYETRYQLQAANPGSMVGKAEMWLTNYFLPLCRQMRTRFEK